MNPVLSLSARAEEADEILTLEELASRLKLSVWTVRRLVRRRVISPLRTGRVLRFHWPTVKHRLGVSPQPPISEGQAHFKSEAWQRRVTVLRANRMKGQQGGAD